jgi:class 3 adenylate cyclase
MPPHSGVTGPGMIAAVSARLRLVLVVAAVMPALIVTLIAGIGAAICLPYAAVGAVLAIRRPTNSVGWLLIALAWGFAISGGNNHATAAEFQSGAVHGTAMSIAVVQSAAGNLLLLLLLALTLVFPNGHLPRGRGRSPALLLLGVMALLALASIFAPTISVSASDSSSGIDIPNPLAIFPPSPIWSLVSSSPVLAFALSVIGLGWMLARLRRASGTEAAQLRWLAWSLGFIFVALTIGLVGDALTPNGLGGLVWVPALVAFPVPPLAIGVAVLRYRLYDIDLLINRTVVYGLVTVILVALFGVAEGLAQRVLETSQRIDLVSAALGFFAALAFGPIRRGVRPVIDRLLPSRSETTLLFTDIVASTQTLVEVGDESWRQLLARYQRVVRQELARFGGREVNTAGDAFFATFGRPALALACAAGIRDAVASIGLHVRIGIHLGEVEMRGEQVSGLAVHTAARVMGEADADEILVSERVAEALSDSGVTLRDTGGHELRGVPGEWRLFAVQAPVAAMSAVLARP